MDEVNLKMKALIDEMKRIGDLPAPCNGGDKHNPLYYREARQRVFDFFLDAFEKGYTLSPPNNGRDQ